MDEINKNLGIWEHENAFSFSVPKQFQITLGEGNTPLISVSKLAAELGVQNLYLKMEMKNPTGSHKDRGLAYQISYHIAQGAKEFVISSSGNSSISAAALLTNRSEKLTIFLADGISETKLARLNKYLTDKSNITLIFTKRPVSQAFQYARKNGAVLLRGSTDKTAVEGYKTIAFELIESGEKIENIILPCSSGTSLTGIYKGFASLNVICPAIQAVQTEFVHPIAQEFDKDYTTKSDSIAEAIVDRVGHRKKEVLDILIKTGGRGWIVSDSEILEAQTMLQRHNIECSNEGAMTIAAIIKAKQSGLNLNNSVCIITGVK